MMLENKFNIGDFVYLTTDPNQFKRVVTGIEVTAKDLIYYLACGEATTKHYDFEISKEKAVIDSE